VIGAPQGRDISPFGVSRVTPPPHSTFLNGVERHTGAVQDMKDFLADWRRWSPAERITAVVLLTLLAAALPALVKAAALV
jgi:hypothetical protein